MAREPPVLPRGKRRDRAPFEF